MMTLRQTAMARLGIGVLQAVCLYLLIEAAKAPPSWPATHPSLATPLLAVSLLIPTAALFGVAQLRLRPLAIWLAAAALMLAGLAYLGVGGRICQASVGIRFATSNAITHCD